MHINPDDGDGLHLEPGQIEVGTSGGYRDDDFPGGIAESQVGESVGLGEHPQGRGMPQQRFIQYGKGGGRAM